jgi:hypothetical protein
MYSSIDSIIEQNKKFLSICSSTTPIEKNRIHPHPTTLNPNDKTSLIEILTPQYSNLTSPIYMNQEHVSTPSYTNHNELIDSIKNVYELLQQDQEKQYNTTKEHYTDDSLGDTVNQLINLLNSFNFSKKRITPLQDANKLTLTDLSSGTITNYLAIDDGGNIIKAPLTLNASTIDIDSINDTITTTTSLHNFTIDSPIQYYYPLFISNLINSNKIRKDSNGSFYYNPLLGMIYIKGITTTETSYIAGYLRSDTAASTYVTFTDISGYALLQSPALTGIPTAPTAISGTNTTQLATTAFVQSAIGSIGSGSISYANVALTGIPTAPTAIVGTNTTQLATTAFVKSAIENISYHDINLTGTATAPTVSSSENSNKIATTSFVKYAIENISYYDINLTGTPTAPTVSSFENSNKIATTSYVTNALINQADYNNVIYAKFTDISGYALLQSPALTGIPTAPSASVGTNTTQLATTAFVQSAIGSISYANLALTGIPTAPTAISGSNTTQLATTAFVQYAVTSTIPNKLLTTQIPAGVSVYYPAMVSSTTTGDKSYFVQNPSNAREFFKFIAPALASDIGTVEISILKIESELYLPTVISVNAYTQIIPIISVTHALGVNSAGNLVKYVPSDQTSISTTSTNANFNLLFTSRNSAGIAQLSIDSDTNIKYNPSTDTFTVPNLTVGSSATIEGANLTGTPTAPTATAGTNTTQIATTSFVQNAVNSSFSSPALTGVPTAPTATAGTNTTQIATTAFVTNVVNSLSSYLPLTGGTVSGNISVTGTANVSGTLDVYGNTTLYGTTRINNASSNTDHLLYLIQSSTSTTTSFPHQSGIAFVGNELQVPGATGNASHSGLGLSLYYSRVNDRWLALSDLNLNRNNTNATLTMGVKGTTGTGLASVTTDFTTYKPLTIDASSLAIGCSTTINGNLNANSLYSNTIGVNSGDFITITSKFINMNCTNGGYTYFSSTSPNEVWYGYNNGNYVGSLLSQSGGYYASNHLQVSNHISTPSDTKNGSGVFIKNGQNGYGFDFWTYGYGPTGASTSVYIISNYTGTGVQMAAGATSWSAYSDRRCKKNINTIGDGHKHIMRLKPIQYKYLTDDKLFPEKSHRHGFVAQEFAEVYPQHVSNNNPPFKDVDGTEIEKPISIHMVEIIPDIVDSVQYLTLKAQRHKDRIITLEETVKSQQDQINLLLGYVSTLTNQVNELSRKINN